jgi:hypothetical protein
VAVSPRAFTLYGVRRNTLAVLLGWVGLAAGVGGPARSSAVEFNVSGRVLVLPAHLTAPPQPSSGIGVTAGSASAVTGPDGRFAFVGVPDGTNVVVQDPSETYYTMAVPAKLASTDLLLLERSNRMFQVILPDGGLELAVPNLAFLREYFCFGVTCNPLHHWEAYPVQVHVPPCDDCTTDNVAAIGGAIQRWNQAFGETILVQVPDPVSVGVEVSHVAPPALPAGAAQVRMCAPCTSCAIGSVVPIRMEVRLSTDLKLQPLAVAVHELGHVLLMHDVDTEGHLMRTSVTGDRRLDVHPDELELAMIARFLPQGTDLDWYVNE